VIIVPDNSAIMTLLQPLYREFRAQSEQLIASFSDEELNVIEAYFIKAIDVMNETINTLNDKKL
jgi:hypothetical protein